MTDCLCMQYCQCTSESAYARHSLALTNTYMIGMASLTIHVSAELAPKTPAPVQVCHSI